MSADGQSAADPGLHCNVSLLHPPPPPFHAWAPLLRLGCNGSLHKRSPGRSNGCLRRYFIFADVVLVLQYIYYNTLQRRKRRLKASREKSRRSSLRSSRQSQRTSEQRGNSVCCFAFPFLPSHPEAIAVAHMSVQATVPATGELSSQENMLGSAYKVRRCCDSWFSQGL